VKIAKTISRFFYAHKTMNIKGLGSFVLNAVPYDTEKTDQNLTNIEFTQNAQAVTDEELIQFLVSETGKMRALAISDLESFVADGKQLLNIGKPFYIDGMGSVQRKSNNEYSFTEEGSGSFNEVNDYAQEKKLRTELIEKPQRKIIETEPVKLEERKSGINWFKVIGATVLGLAIGAAGYFTYKYIFKPKAEDKQAEQPKKETMPLPATNNAKPTAQLTTLPDGQIKYKIIVREAFTKEEGLKLINWRNSNKEYRMKVITQDSISFKGVIDTFSMPADTVKMLSNMKQYYAPKPGVLRLEY
jgi:hypothetical protein